MSSSTIVIESLVHQLFACLVAYTASATSDLLKATKWVVELQPAGSTPQTSRFKGSLFKGPRLVLRVEIVVQ